VFPQVADKDFSHDTHDPVVRPVTADHSADGAEDFRRMSRWADTGIRTACHDCRSVAYELDAKRLHPLLVVGDGSETKLISALAESYEMPVAQPCPLCGDTGEPGWLPGFRPPV
jgi:hypothetical protein